MTAATLSVLFSLSTAMVVGSFALFVRSGQRHANAVSGVLIGIIASFPPLLAGAVWTWEAAHYQPRAWLFFALAGVMGPAVGRACFFHSIHLMGVTRAVPLNSTMPLFSAVAGVLVLGERPGPHVLAGTLLIVLGCAGITSKRGEAPPVRGRHLLVALAGVVFFSVSHLLRKLGVASAPNPFVGVPDDEGRLDEGVVRHDVHLAPTLRRRKRQHHLPRQMQQQRRILAPRIGDDPRVGMPLAVFPSQNLAHGVEAGHDVIAVRLCAGVLRSGMGLKIVDHAAASCASRAGFQMCSARRL